MPLNAVSEQENSNERIPNINNERKSLGYHVRLMLALAPAAHWRNTLPASGNKARCECFRLGIRLTKQTPNGQFGNREALLR